MCGIAGIVSLSERPVECFRVKAMCDTIAHRGPDDAGYVFFADGSLSEFVDPEFRHKNEHLPVFDEASTRDKFGHDNIHVAFGHRRLSILDLSHLGHQPMASADRRYWITYNGEIYNFPELKRHLASKGYIFRTATDTEVLIALWQEYGKESLGMLNGMFAFAIYDRCENLITLARDRFGVKPLYYTATGGSFIFCSEIKGILASKLVNPELNRASVVQYFTFQNLFGAETLFDGIKMLQQGEYLSIVQGKGVVNTPCRYHRISSEVDMQLKEKPELAVEMVADAFKTAVNRQLISDVEVGAYLSGGMDSGSIVAVAGRSRPRLLTFTGGFDLTNVNGIEQGFDERQDAEKLSYLLQTEHYDVVLHAGDMPAAMDAISWHMDDPRVGMCHQVWYVAKLASRFAKVCLAGSGGDELFGGYPWRYRNIIDSADYSDFDNRYFRYWHRMLSSAELADIFDFDISCESLSPFESFLSVMADAPEYMNELTKAENMINRALYFEKNTFLHGLLVTEDKISMAHGLETRVPFLDNDLVDLAWKLPPSMKVNTEALMMDKSADHICSTDGKQVLRKAMRNFLPEAFTTQHKQGFSPPDENWFRGPSMDYIKEILLSEEARRRPLFKHSVVESKLEEHFNGKHNHRLLIWSLLSFEWLHRHFFDS